MCLNDRVCLLVGGSAAHFVGLYIVPDHIALNDIKVNTILGPFSASHIMMIVHNNPSTSSTSSNKFSPFRQPNYWPDFYKPHHKWISYLMWPNKTFFPKINSAEFKQTITKALVIDARVKKKTWQPTLTPNKTDLFLQSQTIAHI